MSSTSSTSVTLRDLYFAWPDGTVALDSVSGTFGRRRTGLIGANGAGKSTLLRLVAGTLLPSGGSVAVTGTVDHLPQRVAAGPGTTVADLLGLTAVRASLRAIEAGSADPAHFERVGDAWDAEERAVAELAALALPTDLDRPVATLSGGEAVLTAVTGVRLRRADVALLDEPTNNLDLDARERLHELVRTWRGTLVVVSHDATLLDRLDETAELRSGELVRYGGPYSSYREHLARQQDTALQVLRTSEQEVRKQKRERVQAEVRIAHSERKGRKDRENRKYLGVVFNDRKNAAEKSQGTRRGRADARVARAEEAVRAAEAAVRDDDVVRIDLVDPQVPSSRRLAELPSADGRHHRLHGPERVALVGPNGVGKSTLLRDVVASAHGRVGYLPQVVDLDDDATVLEVVAAAAPGLTVGEVRNRLARLLVRGAMVEQEVGSLSGGERFRVALARLVLADPVPELLVLDEPTNNLDLASTDQLVAALASYRGGLLVVSHDRAFLGRLDLDVVLRMEAGGRLVRE